MLDIWTDFLYRDFQKYVHEKLGYQYKVEAISYNKILLITILMKALL